MLEIYLNLAIEEKKTRLLFFKFKKKHICVKYQEKFQRMFLIHDYFYILSNYLCSFILF